MKGTNQRKRLPPIELIDPFLGQVTILLSVRKHAISVENRTFGFHQGPASSGMSRPPCNNLIKIHASTFCVFKIHYCPGARHLEVQRTVFQ